jgi:hypothetical protein
MVATPLSVLLLGTLSKNYKPKPLTNGKPSPRLRLSNIVTTTPKRLSVGYMKIEI